MKWYTVALISPHFKRNLFVLAKTPSAAARRMRKLVAAYDMIATKEVKIVAVYEGQQQDLYKGKP
jgi:hypothetical protein